MSRVTADGIEGTMFDPTLPAWIYHTDPCATPSLSASIAGVIDRQSPAHAAARHPRLEGVPRKDVRSLDSGSIIHAMVLQQADLFQVVDAKDWRTKAAKERRAAIRADRKTPILVHDQEILSLAAKVGRERLAELCLLPEDTDRSDVRVYRECSIFWVEPSSSGPVQCRSRLDALWLEGPDPSRPTSATILDLKTSRSAHPDACRGHVEAYGYAIQQAAYVRAVEAAFPSVRGRVSFVLAFLEIVHPYVVLAARLSTAFADIGRAKWERAVNTWGRCLSRNEWPAYAPGIVTLEPPSWLLAKEAIAQYEDERATSAVDEEEESGGPMSGVAA